MYKVACIDVRTDACINTCIDTRYGLYRYGPILYLSNVLTAKYSYGLCSYARMRAPACPRARPLCSYARMRARAPARPHI